jgi:hypothetical protein
VRCRNCGADDFTSSAGRLICSYCRSVFSETEVTGRREPRAETVVVRQVTYVHEDRDRLGVGLGCLCFLLYPLAWIIWALSLRSSPHRARVALVIALLQTAFLVAGVLAGIIEDAGA